MRIEVSRSWLLVEIRRHVVTVIWPGSPAADAFTDSCDRRFGWTTEGDEVAQTRETRFSCGRVFATVERKPVGATAVALAAGPAISAGGA